MAEQELFVAGSDVAGKVCSVCQTTIIAGEHIVFCADCSLPFHGECWEENRGCSQYGCKSAPATEKVDFSGELASSVWGSEKACPSCGKSIKAQALKCRFCGADFETRDLISSKAYAAREYTDTDYYAARNKIIALFLCAATGCAAPIALVMFSMLIFKKRCMGLEHERLPVALRAMSVAGLVLSCLLLMLFLVILIFDR